MPDAAKAPDLEIPKRATEEDYAIRAAAAAALAQKYASPPITADELREIGLTMFGSYWVLNVAQGLGLSKSAVTHMVHGQRPFPPYIAERLREFILLHTCRVICLLLKPGVKGHDDPKTQALVDEVNALLKAARSTAD